MRGLASFEPTSSASMASAVKPASHPPIANFLDRVVINGTAGTNLLDCPPPTPPATAEKGKTYTKRRQKESGRLRNTGYVNRAALYRNIAYIVIGRAAIGIDNHLVSRGMTVGGLQ
jgi:hypothetical protein